jgi:hypothetical protein
MRFARLLPLVIAALVCVCACSKGENESGKSTTPSRLTPPESGAVTDDTAGDTGDRGSGAPEANIRVMYRAGEDDFLQHSGSFIVYADARDGSERVIISTDTAVRNFEFFEGGLDFDDLNTERSAYPFFIDKVLYSINELLPEKPFLALKLNVPELYPKYGVSFTDAHNTKRYFILNWSGMDGSLYLSELSPSLCHYK